MICHACHSLVVLCPSAYNKLWYACGCINWLPSPIFGKLQNNGSVNNIWPQKLPCLTKLPLVLWCDTVGRFCTCNFLMIEFFTVIYHAPTLLAEVRGCKLGTNSPCSCCLWQSYKHGLRNRLTHDENSIGVAPKNARVLISPLLGRKVRI